MKIKKKLNIIKKNFLPNFRRNEVFWEAYLQKGEWRDVFLNNYIPQLSKDDPSNHDIQIIAGEEGAFAVVSYIANTYWKKKLDKAICLRG